MNDTVNFVKKVEHSNIKINYDLGNYYMENDTFVFDKTNIHLIRHIQVSNSFLKPLYNISEELKYKYSKQIKEVLELGYNKAISLEMIETTYTNFIRSLDTFVKIITNK
jgi:sugar phosphate isomerase/epimerase